MNKVNALRVRQAFGKVLKDLERTGEPLLIEKGRNPVAVLISLKVFLERFIDYREEKKREDILKTARTSATRSARDSLSILKELRYGAGH